MAKGFTGYWSTKCDGCSGKNIPYTIKNTLWNKVAKAKDQFLCLFCVEDRLGRKLYKKDFVKCPINLGCFGFHYSMWTKHRLTRQDFDVLRKKFNLK